MPETTDLTPLPYPLATDQPFVHLDLQALAEATAQSLYVECTASTRPAHKLGRRIFESDTLRTYISNGTQWWQIGGPPHTVSVTFRAGWRSSTTSVPLRCYRLNDRAYLVGGIDNSITQNVPANFQHVVADMPLAARPSVGGNPRAANSPTMVNVAGVDLTWGSLRVATDGRVIIQVGESFTDVPAADLTIDVPMLEWQTSSLAGG